MHVLNSITTCSQLIDVTDKRPALFRARASMEECSVQGDNGLMLEAQRTGCWLPDVNPDCLGKNIAGGFPGRFGPPSPGRRPCSHALSWL